MSANRHSPLPRTSRTNSLAIAALVCGIIQFVVPPALIATIVLGHVARRQIRRTGEAGYGLATAGLVLGYIYLTLAVFGVLLLGCAGAVPVHGA